MCMILVAVLYNTFGTDKALNKFYSAKKIEEQFGYFHWMMASSYDRISLQSDRNGNHYSQAKSHLCMRLFMCESQARSVYTDRYCKKTTKTQPITSSQRVIADGGFRYIDHFASTAPSRSLRVLPLPHLSVCHSRLWHSITSTHWHLFISAHASPSTCDP